MRAFILLFFSASLIGISAPQSSASSDSPCFTVTETGENNETKTVHNGSSCVGSITIPIGITEIDDFAFQGATELTSIYISSSVRHIGIDAFKNTTSLREVVFQGESLLETIEQGAFLNATSLESITIPKRVTLLGPYSFYNAEALTSVFFEEDSSLTSLSAHTFDGADALANVVLPKNITTIGIAAFQHVQALSTITIPANVTAIAQYAFWGATNLSSVRFLGAPPTVSTQAFIGVSGDAKAIVNRSQFESFTAEALSDEDWDDLALELYTYPSGDTSCLVRTSTQITNGADCVGAITVPNSVSTIQNDAFFRAESVTSLTLPSTVTSIGDRAFESATALSLIRFLGAAPTVGSDAFLNIPSGSIARVDQVHQSTFTLVDGLWNGFILEVVIPPANNSNNSGNTASNRENERLREEEKKVARSNLVSLAKDSAPLTLDLFNQASIPGVTSANFTEVSLEISELPIERRSQLSEILQIARKFEVVDKVASNQKIYSGMLQEVGLIPRDSKNKAALTAALRKLPASERSSYLAIKQAIDAQMTEIQTRKQRLSEVLASIEARRQS
jgi:hypothetical protein